MGTVWVSYGWTRRKPLENQGVSKCVPHRGVMMEVPPGFEPGHNGFADRGLTTWLRCHINIIYALKV